MVMVVCVDGDDGGRGRDGSVVEVCVWWGW